MKTSSVLFFAGLLVIVQSRSHQRGSGSSSDSSTDDTLNVFGVTSNPGSSESDSASFSVIDQPGSQQRRQSGKFTNGGSLSGRASSNSNDRNGDSSSNAGNRGPVDTGFERLTTQDDRGMRRTTTDRFSPDRSGSSGDRDNSDGGFGSSANRGRTTTDRSSVFDNSGRDTDSSSGSLNGGRERGSSGGSSRFPDNYRMEVEMQRLENKGGILANGKTCDTLSACDTKITAFIDTESPSASWPGSTPLAKWPVIISVSNVNSPPIGKVVTRDVCGGVSDVDHQVNLRAFVVDTNSIVSNSEINRFKCLFPITVSSIASDSSAAQWGQPMECTATSQVGKIKLFVRQRAYQISSSNCNSQKL